ncbi:MAG: hypothetical protein SynsKO_03560 [Synoicihabitans sp.]
MRGIVYPSLLLVVTFTVGFSVARWSIDSVPPPTVKSEKTEVFAAQEILPAAGKEPLAQQLRNLESPRERVMLLQSLGFPDQAIRSLLGGLYSDIVHEPISAEIFDRTPWWKALPQTYTNDPEKRERHELVMREVNEALSSRVNVWALRKAQQRYGIFDAEKTHRLNVILSDYRALRSQWRDGPEQEREAAMALLADEQTRDIQALLSPEEFERYSLRTSPGLKYLADRFEDIEVTVEEFESLIPIWSQKSVYGSNDYGSEDRLAQRRAEFEIDREVWTTLGDERFWSYKIKADNEFRRLVEFSEKTDLSRDQIWSLWEMRIEAPPADTWTGEGQITEKDLLGVIGAERLEALKNDQTMRWLSSGGNEG